MMLVLVIPAEAGIHLALLAGVPLEKKGFRGPGP
jgi:hypothetical protein